MSVESNIAVLEQKLNTTDTVLERLADSFEKMSDVHNKLTNMLSIHGEKIQNQAITTEANRQVLLSLSNEHKEATAQLYVRMDTNELKLMNSINNIMEELKERDIRLSDRLDNKYEKFNERIVVLESWKWKSIGIAIGVLGLLQVMLQVFLKAS